jgi:O-antigen ligase
VPLTVLVALGAIYSWRILLSQTAQHALPENIQLFIAYFAVMSLSMLVGYLPVNSYVAWSETMIKIAAMVLAMTWLARKPRDFTIAATAFIIAGTFVAVVVIYNQWHGISLVEGDRVTIGAIPLELKKPGEEGGVLSDPNDLALILMFPLAFALAQTVYATSLWRTTFATLTSGAIFWAIVATKSRGAFIGIVAVILAVGLLRWRSRVLSMILVAMIGIFAFGAMGMSERWDTGGAATESGLDESSQGRINAWRTAIKMAIRSPLSGVGLNNFVPMYYSFTDNWEGRPRATHSMWLEVLSESGVIAFAFFVAMVIASFKMNLASLHRLDAVRAPHSLRASAVGLQAALIGTCASGTFLSQSKTWPIYVVVAMIAALSILARDLQSAGVGAISGSVDDAGNAERLKPAPSAGAVVAG